jgi:hypothetical protein
MKPMPYIAAAVFAATASSPVLAQFVKGNEAVKVLPNGGKHVETPPLPTSTLAKPCPAEQPACVGSSWLMLETPSGLMECTELYARPGTCRASTYGTEQRFRVWVVKTHGEWMQCQRPDLKSKCVSIKSLPISAVQ